jgi:hypothetical protein
MQRWNEKLTEMNKKKCRKNGDGLFVASCEFSCTQCKHFFSISCAQLHVHLTSEMWDFNIVSDSRDYDYDN